MYMYIMCVYIYMYIYIYICIYTGSDFGSAKLFEVTGLEVSQFRFRDAQPADGRQLRARLGSGQRFPCSVLDVPLLDMGRQMTAVELQKRKRHFTLDSLWFIYRTEEGIDPPSIQSFLRSTSEFHDSREGHALQRLVDACFGRELRNGMDKNTNCSCCGGVWQLKMNWTNWRFWYVLISFQH